MSGPVEAGIYKTGRLTVVFILFCFNPRGLKPSPIKLCTWVLLKPDKPALWAKLPRMQIL